MPKTTLRTVRFSEWLVEQRSDRSLATVAALVRKAIGGVLAFDRSSWKKLEDGQMPSIVQLWGISRALKVPFIEVARQVLQDLDVPVDEPPKLPEPPLSPEAVAIARLYQAADDERRRAARFVLGAEVGPRPSSANNPLTSPERRSRDSQRRKGYRS